MANISHCFDTWDRFPNWMQNFGEWRWNRIGRLHWQTLSKLCDALRRYSHRHQLISIQLFHFPCFQHQPQPPSIFLSCAQWFSGFATFILYVYWFEMNLRVSEAKRRIRFGIGISQHNKCSNTTFRTKLPTTNCNVPMRWVLLGI